MMCLHCQSHTMLVITMFTAEVAQRIRFSQMFNTEVIGLFMINAAVDLKQCVCNAG
jgi:hypothetical protein